MDSQKVSLSPLRLILTWPAQAPLKQRLVIPARSTTSYEILLAIILKRGAARLDSTISESRTECTVFSL